MDVDRKRVVAGLSTVDGRCLWIGMLLVSGRYVTGFWITVKTKAIMPLIHDGCVRQYYRVDKREIHYLKFILEGYDGLAVMRTVDSEAGSVVLHVAPGCEQDVSAIVDDLKGHIRIEASKPGQ